MRVESQKSQKNRFYGPWGPIMKIHFTFGPNSVGATITCIGGFENLNFIERNSKYSVIINQRFWI